MNSQFRKILCASVILALCLSLMAGCSNTATSNDKSQKSSDVSEVNKALETEKPSADNTVIVSTAPTVVDDSQKNLLVEMKNLAQQGKIINSEFPVKSTVIDAVEKKLGKTDKTDWVPAAKGNYATFSKYNVVFGFNKGSQIFEVRSFDSRLNKISLSMVKKAYGTPAYDMKNNGEEIIGYTAGQEYKILLVFSKPANTSDDPSLDHYSVLYPKGTVNIMADDPGREW